MNKSILLFILFTVPFSSAFAQKEQAIERKGYSYHTVRESCRITIESKAGSVTVLELKKGVIYSVKYDSDRNPIKDIMKGKYRGDMILRIRRAEGVLDPDGKGKPAKEIMAVSPVQMELKECTLIVEEYPGK